MCLDMVVSSCRGQSGPTIRNYNYHSYSSPPVYGYGGGGYGYGGGGITLMPSFGVPVSFTVIWHVTPSCSMQAAHTVLFVANP